MQHIPVIDNYIEFIIRLGDSEGININFNNIVNAEEGLYTEIFFNKEGKFLKQNFNKRNKEIYFKSALDY